jgi:hypothetical protein
MGKGADVGVAKKTSRKRAVGTREHIIAYLAQASELFDANGMASTQLAAAVGYPGSSVAFAQLLSGMERSGLIEREVRGKRTYRITLGSAGAGSVVAGPELAASPGPGEGDGLGVPASPAGADGVSAQAAFDYDELARRLLVQVVRRLAVTETGSDQAALQETVTGLEHELASAWTKHGQLAEENIRLREQLKAAALALARERVRQLPATADLDRSEVVLLQRLLSPEYGGPEYDGTVSDADGLADVRSLLS